MDAASPGYSKAHALRRGGVSDVREALREIRARTLSLADRWEAALPLEVPYRPALNPALWEWGHVAWFQEWWIGRNRERDRGIACEPFHDRTPSLLAGADALFDSGRVAHESRWRLPLPDSRGTRAYLAGTFDQTLQALDALPEDAPDNALYFFRLVALHEAMHTEATTYMARSLGADFAPAPAPLSEGRQLRFAARAFRLGSEGGGFAFDNELRAHEVALAAFEIDDRPVSWRRFMAFVEDGGYADARWWDDAGRAWLGSAGVPRHDPAAPDAAADAITLHEARAWCRWAGRRLPSEAEWECAAVSDAAFRWGDAWEWTSSAFGPYPGFEAHPYRDYSAPWFGTRQVLRGACRATSAWLAHPAYRNFFEPHRADLYSGFRTCAADDGRVAV